MHYRFVIVLITFLSFFSFTLYVIVARDVSLFTYLGALQPNSWATQILVDLYIACTLLCLWIIKDTRARGKSISSAIPFLVLTFFLASMGPLLYLLLREWEGRHPANSELK